MIDSTNVRVLADNIQQLQKDSSGLGSRVAALEATAPKDYSTRETATGRKWIDGKEIYCKVITGNIPAIESTQNISFDDIPNIDIFIYGFLLFDYSESRQSLSTNRLVANPVNNSIYAEGVTVAFSEKPFRLVIYYTKPDPTPGRAPEDREPEPEEKKTTKKKTTK